MITKECYLADPCGTLSIPFWKAKTIAIPEGVLIVHRRDYDKEKYSHYADDRYFRLYHDLRSLTTPRLPEGFAVRAADLHEYAEHISECYGGACLTESDLRGYVRRPVYHPSLWLAVQAQATGKLAASGIAEFDADTGEAALEWIQVSQEHRRKGLGKFVVSELLCRMQQFAGFATVSGNCRNSSEPEKLYRSCGFTGNDIWHILKRSDTL